MFTIRPLLAHFGLTAALLLAACPDPALLPLVGEDPEIEVLLGTSDRAQLRSSPLAAARRLHQALSQEDFESAWELLSATTRSSLDERGAIIRASGRELLDASALPTSAGTMRRVRYVSLFFGLDTVDLLEDSIEGHRAIIIALDREGARRQLLFEHDGDLWRLTFTDF